MKEKAEQNAGGEMTLSGHLRELRNRIAVVFAAFVVANIIFLSRAEKIANFLTDMGTSCGYEFVFLSPQELLVQYFKLSLLSSFIILIPLILYQCWAFASPGLSKKESRGMVIALFFGVICFVIGVLFAYKITLPFMLSFLIKLGTGTMYQASIGIANYLDFVLLVFIIFGCIFEMPLLCSILARLGLVTPQLLKKIRPTVIVVIFIVAALITPPDIFSQIMVALPMIVLYQISILLSGILGRKKK